MSIGIPSTVMVCLDWWVWELLVLISGYLGTLEQATNIVIMNIILITYMITMGLETAACTLVGQEIGADNLGEAKKLFDSIMKVSTCMLLTTSLGLFIFKE